MPRPGTRTPGTQQAGPGRRGFKPELSARLGLGVSGWHCGILDMNPGVLFSFNLSESLPYSFGSDFAGRLPSGHSSDSSHWQEGLGDRPGLQALAGRRAGGSVACQLDCGGRDRGDRGR
jgi:hypothetical protein